jgi:metal-responsive CopG/Arc/MetJ family transcriptional regulator
MKTAISIPDALYEDAERYATTRGWTRSRLYTEAVREFLAQERRLGVRERLDAVYRVDSGASALDPALAHAQHIVIARDEW